MVVQIVSRTAISLLALLVGAAAFGALITSGIPKDKPASLGRRIKSVSTTRSRCPARCRGPERTERSVNISSLPPAPADEPSVVEKSIDNDGGVLVIRFLIALSTALTTAVTLKRLFGRREPGGSSGSDPYPARNQDNGGRSQGGGGPEPEPRPAAHQQSGSEREERDAQMHEVAVKRQALLKAALRRRPKIKIKF
jgi:hypothetical protein